MLGDMLYDMFPEELGIEQKITLAASFLLSILNLKATSEAQKRLAVKTALERCEGFEPLWPFLGDEEWESVGLPETEYLLFADSKALYSQAVAVLAGSLLEELPGISAADAAAALLFHLDSGFRQGVTSMIAPQIGKMNGKVEYLPAVYVGGARPPPGAHR